MSWAETSKLNSDLKTPLNHLLWLQDYKIFGTSSIVYNDKSKLDELYKDSSLCLPDKAIYTEAINYHVEQDTIGYFLATAPNMENNNFAQLVTLDKIVNNADACNTLVNYYSNVIGEGVIDNTTNNFLRRILDNSTIYNKLFASDTAITAMCNSDYFLNTFCKSGQKAYSTMINSEQFMNIAVNNDNFINTYLVNKEDLQSLNSSAAFAKALADSEKMYNHILGNEELFDELFTKNIANISQVFFNKQEFINIVFTDYSNKLIDNLSNIKSCLTNSTQQQLIPNADSDSTSSYWTIFENQFCYVVSIYQTATSSSRQLTYYYGVNGSSNSHGAGRSSSSYNSWYTLGFLTDYLRMDCTNIGGGTSKNTVQYKIVAPDYSIS